MVHIGHFFWNFNQLSHTRFFRYKSSYYPILHVITANHTIILKFFITLPPIKCFSQMKRNIIINLHVVDNPQWFESVILYLKSAYNIVPLSAFAHDEQYKKPNSLCSITFDDGDLTFYNVAFPILKKHHVPAAIFVSPQSIKNHENFWFQEIADYDVATMAKIIASQTIIPFEIAKNYGLHALLKCFPLGQIHHFIQLYQKQTSTAPKEFRNMDLEKILEVNKSDLIIIGAHTLTHPVLANETDEKCRNEIVQSITDLSQMLNQDIQYFAYPNGTFGLDFSQREMDILKKNNIKIALSTDPDFVSKNSDKMAFPRKGITLGSIAFIKMKILLGKKWNFVKNIRTPSEQKKRIILKKNFL